MADADAWGDAGEKYNIHQETFGFFRKMKELGAKAYGEATAEEMRGQALRRNEVFAGAVDFTGSEKEFTVPSGDNEAGVPVSVYKPSEISKVPAILVYFHGGGMVFCSRNTHATSLKIIARRAGCVVVNVEFRLAPEFKAPAAFDDCRAVARWVLQNKVLIGGEAESRVGLGGDSCGGQLVASIAHDVSGLDFQILVYPITDLSLPFPSYEEFAATPGLNTSGMKWIMSQFLKDDKQKEDPVLSPFLRPSFTGLPPALCILAQLDPLRDDGIAYAKKLSEAGVPTQTLVVEGAPHTFFSLPGHFQQLTKQAYDVVVEFLDKFQQK